MEAAQEIPFDWLRYVSHTLVKLDEIPLFGSSPPFPWEEFSSKIAECFSVEGFKMEPSEWRWRSSEELLAGLGDPLHPVNFTISPLLGSASWLMAEDHVNQLMNWLLQQRADALRIPEHDYREAFYRFISLEAINIYQQLGITPDLVPTLSSRRELPQENGLCLDVVISYQRSNLVGRLVIAPELRRTWKDHHGGALAAGKQPLAKDLEVTVHVEVGKAEMTRAQWSEVSAGDYVILDSCSAEPGQEKGRVLLTIEGRPAFRGMIKQNKVKLLEYPLYREVEGFMEPNNLEEESNHSEFEEFEELPEPRTDEELEEEEEEWEEEEEEEEENLEETPLEPLEEETTVPETEIPPPKTETPVQPAPSGPISTEDIPLLVSVEVTRLKMSVKTLLELQPGNMLELDARPERGVSLVVNDKIIAKGELIRIGEVLGVRILSVGN